MAGKTLQSTIEIAGSLSPSLQQAIKQAVDRLEEMSQETLESAGAAAKLAAEISTQESVLKNLQLLGWVLPSMLMVSPSVPIIVNGAETIRKRSSSPMEN